MFPRNPENRKKTVNNILLKGFLSGFFSSIITFLFISQKHTTVVMILIALFSILVVLSSISFIFEFLVL